MKKILLPALAAFSLIIAACGGSEPKPQVIHTIPQNPADIDPTNVESVQTTEGLSSRTLLQGEGAIAEVGHTAVVHYTGWLHDSESTWSRGTKFDSSVDRGAHFRFPIGAQRVIRGWDEGVAGMRIGEVRELTIAPEMGYGDRGAGGVIPPGATLVFVVELADLEGLEQEAPDDN
ncbi:MAG: FKBP-type peptidyl-prolyl cis-trans isomerase [Woeseiaceae bacterium]|nr:FKBP-type peptidyl-prolyl cis-trans isomerase [Woeseiaceae bacterium]